MLSTTTLRKDAKDVEDSGAVTYSYWFPLQSPFLCLLYVILRLWDTLADGRICATIEVSH